MQKVSFKKLSLLGLVLIAASAAASALMPSKDKAQADCNGFVTASSEVDGPADATCSIAGDRQFKQCYTINDDGDVGVNSSSGTNADGITTTADTKGTALEEDCATVEA